MAIVALLRSGVSFCPIPSSLGDDGYSDDFQTVNPTRTANIKSLQQEGEQDQSDDRWKRKTKSSCQSAEQSGADDADSNTHLTAGRAGQKLAQCDQIRIASFVHPFAAAYVFIMKITEMSDRSFE